MQGQNYDYIFRKLITLSLKRANLICGDSCDEDTKRERLFLKNILFPDVIEAAEVYDEKIKSFVNGLSLDEIKNIVLVKSIGQSYLMCFEPDEFYKKNSPEKIYSMETKRSYFTGNNYHSQGDAAKEYHCNSITKNYLLHDYLITGLKILKFI